eukprot:547234_1
MLLMVALFGEYAFARGKIATLAQLGPKKLMCSWTEVPGATTYKIWLLRFRSNDEYEVANTTVHVVATTEMEVTFKSTEIFEVRDNRYFCTVEAMDVETWFGEQWSSQISLIPVNAKAPTAPPLPTD